MDIEKQSKRSRKSPKTREGEEDGLYKQVRTPQTCGDKENGRHDNINRHRHDCGC